MEAGTSQIKVQSDDLEYVVDFVKSKLVTYDVVVDPISIKFYYFNSDNPDLTEAFDEIRKELVPKNYVPFLNESQEHFLEVTRRPETHFRGVIINIILLIATLASTIYVGTLWAEPFFRGLQSRIFYGFVFFSLPIMAILGIHETGHFIVARLHKVRASLPFFIPIPYEIGTFGAFISLRDPMPNRKVMTEIGIAGPIFGFVTALPLLFVANYFSHIYAPIPGIPSPYPFVINYPLIYSLFHLHYISTRPVFPMVLAVWVGMFATAMNLIPAGQLDGGHVIRGLLGKKANYVDYIFVGFLFIAGFYYTGWWIIAILVVLMGLTHPPALDDYSNIKSRDIALGVIALLMFAVTFTIIPISALP